MNKHCEQTVLSVKESEIRNKYRGRCSFQMSSFQYYISLKWVAMFNYSSNSTHLVALYSYMSTKVTGIHTKQVINNLYPLSV